MSENIFKQGCLKDMFMVDTVSFPGLWYPFGEYVYTLLSAGIYQAKMPLGKGDLLFAPLYFERFSGYKSPLKLKPMMLRLITVIIGLCNRRKICSLPLRLNMKGSRSKGIIKVFSFCKDSQEQEEVSFWKIHRGIEGSSFSEDKVILCNLAPETTLGHNHLFDLFLFCFICDANAHLGNLGLF